MRYPFLNRHINTFLTQWEKSPLPLDLSLSRYFRAHPNLGSKDRKEIGDTLYGMVRWKSLIDHFSPEDRLSFYQSIDWTAIGRDPTIPPFAQKGLSPFLYGRFCASFGEETTSRLAMILNQNGPTTIRANLLKITREELLDRWKERFSISPCLHSSAGLRFHKREPLFSLPEFKEGLFEVQDEGSQLIASLIEAKEGDWVLDYCSGSGGKTLAFAPSMKGKGQIYLHDIRPHALQEAKKRLKRAGIQNSQCLNSHHPQMRKLKGKCDWVLIDVPCSGTGTLRRNPDQKWKIDALLIDRLVEEQRKIGETAFSFVKKGGRLVYATCSLLKEENEAQVDYFLRKLPLKLEKPPLSLFPEIDGPDGFFAAVFLVS